MPGSFSDFPALNLFTDRKVSGERIGNGRIPERVIFYSDSMRAVSRLAINHTLKPERRLNSRYVVIDAQEHRLDAETLDVIGSDQWLPSAKLSSIHSVHFVTLGHETTKPLSSIARQIGVSFDGDGIHRQRVFKREHATPAVEAC